MYTVTAGMGAGQAAAGAIVLPNTGSNEVLAVVSIINIVVGVAIVATSAARLIAKKAYNA